MSHTFPLPPTPTTLNTLTSHTHLLHLLAHRNKNQHRRSTWWRHLSTFRRHLSHLLADLTTLATPPTTHLERARKPANDEILTARVVQRLEVWRDVCVPKWQRAFGQVVADPRFAVLGVVLLAVLAECCAVLGVTGALEEMGEVEVRRVIEEFGREMAEDEEGADRGGVGGEDLGEVVGRESVEVEREDVAGGGEDGVKGGPGVEEDKRRKKRKVVSNTTTMSARKKSKKKNTIDDLFSSLD